MGAGRTEGWPILTFLNQTSHLLLDDHPLEASVDVEADSYAWSSPRPSYPCDPDPAFTCPPPAAPQLQGSPRSFCPTTGRREIQRPAPTRRAPAALCSGSYGRSPAPASPERNHLAASRCIPRLYHPDTHRGLLAKVRAGAVALQASACFREAGSVCFGCDGSLPGGVRSRVMAALSLQASSGASSAEPWRTSLAFGRGWPQKKALGLGTSRHLHLGGLGEGAAPVGRG